MFYLKTERDASKGGYQDFDARSSGASPANGPEPVQVSPGGEGRGGPFAAPEKEGSIKVNPALLHLLQ